MAKNTTKNKVTDLLADLLSPVRFAAGGLIQAPILAASKGKLNVPFLAEDELQKLSGNTLMDRLKKSGVRGAKETLEASSYAVPFGKAAQGAGLASRAVTKALAPGALVGLLQGLSSEKVTPKGVAMSTVGGAAGAGLLQGGASLLGKTLRTTTKDVPDRLMNSVFKEKIGDTKASLKGGVTLGQEALSRGIKGKNAASIYGEAVSKIGALEDEISGAIQSSKRIIPIADIKQTVKPLIKKYSDAGDLSAVKSITDRITALEEQHGASIPIQVAQEVKRTLYDELNGSYGMLKNAEKEGLKTIARSLKEGIASKVTSKNINKLNKELSVYGRIKDSMLDKMTREERNNIIGLTDAIIGGGGLASGVGIPAIGAIALKKILGSTAGKTNIANVLSKGAGLVPQGENAMLSNILGQAGAQTGARAASMVSNPQQSTQVPATNEQKSENNNETLNHTQSIPEQSQGQERIVTDDNGNKFIEAADGSILSEDKQWKFDDASQDWVPNQAQQTAGGSGIGNEQLQGLLVEALLSGDKKKLDLVTKYIESSKLLDPEAKKQKALSGPNSVLLNKAQTGIKAIDRISKSIESDPNAVIKYTVNPLSQTGRSIGKDIKSAIDILGYFRTGAAITADQRKDYIYMFPSILDDEATKKEKIRVLREELEGYANGISSTVGNTTDPLTELLNSAGGQTRTY